MDCKKCSLAIDGQPYVFCNGVCSGVFHAACVSIRREYLLPIAASRNIVWLCEICMTEFEKWKKLPIQPDASCTSIASVEEEIVKLKTEVERIATALSSITSSPSPSSSEILHSTPAQFSPLQSSYGTNTYHDSSQHSHTVLDPIDEDQHFALLLTNIHTSVSETDIERMVLQSLDASDGDQICVQKLVPKWVDYTSRDYISFKVVLNVKWKPIALKSSTWPTGVRFRKFIQRQASWKPAM